MLLVDFLQLQQTGATLHCRAQALECVGFRSCGTCMPSRFSSIQLFVTTWTVVRQVPLSMGFSRQEYWSGLPCSPPGNLPDPGVKPMSPMSPALAGRFFTTSATMGLGANKWDLSSQARDGTHIPCIGRSILYHWATREVPEKSFKCQYL